MRAFTFPHAEVREVRLEAPLIFKLLIQHPLS